jgi:hypothetical protein
LKIKQSHRQHPTSFPWYWAHLLTQTLFAPSQVTESGMTTSLSLLSNILSEALDCSFAKAVAGWSDGKRQ